MDSPWANNVLEVILLIFKFISLELETLGVLDIYFCDSSVVQKEK